VAVVVQQHPLVHARLDGADEVDARHGHGAHDDRAEVAVAVARVHDLDGLHVVAPVHNGARARRQRAVRDHVLGAARHAHVDLDEVCVGRDGEARARAW
jgi:hypothetical protein